VTRSGLAGGSDYWLSCDRAHELGRKKGMAPGNKADAAKSEEAVKRCARTRCHGSASAQIFPVAPATRAPTAAGVPPAGQPPRAAPGTAHANRMGPRSPLRARPSSCYTSLSSSPAPGFCWLPGERSVDQGVSCESRSRGLENCSTSFRQPPISSFRKLNKKYTSADALLAPLV
jgi:hypothetical protein